MATRIRSFSKVNLGLRIGAVRADGFHGLATMYQTLGLYDIVTVSARRVEAGGRTRISLTTDHPRVPVDGRNTAWQMVERALAAMGVEAEVSVHIEKRLPVQGGMGAGSANAAAALIGLEREMLGWEVAGPELAGPELTGTELAGTELTGPERLRLASAVGSDVPLFLVGGSVLGLGRGELVVAMPDVILGGDEARTLAGGGVPCVVAMPRVGVSTPFAFREWDGRHGGRLGGQPGASTVGADEEPSVLGEIEGRVSVDDTGSGVSRLTSAPAHDTLDQLSLAYSSAFALSAGSGSKPGTSGIVGGHGLLVSCGVDSRGARNDLAGNTLLALVRIGIENDFEEVVFPYHPSLREIKRLLMGEDSGQPAVYAALSGSGSALFGLYWSEGDARAAQQRVQSSGTEAILTETLTRAEYWTRMFANEV